MGKINKVIPGAFSGIVGPSVGSSWKNIGVIRSRPPRRRRNSSEGQLRQMAKYGLVTSFVAPLTGLLNKAYDCVTVDMSCFNKAMSYNVRNAVDGEYPGFRISYPRFILGMGDLLNPPNPKVSSEFKGTITFSWEDNSGQGSAQSADEIFVALYCEDPGEWETRSGITQRMAGSCLLDVTAFSGKAVQTYMGFTSADEKYVSTSLYTGVVNVL